MDRALAVLLLSLLFSGVNSHSNGAGSAACSTLTPGHESNQPQTDPSPYSITTSVDQYTTGGTVTGEY